MTEKNYLGKAREMAEKYAEAAAYKLNSDKKIVDAVLAGLAENEKRYGYRYCPCRVVSGNPKQDVVNICPCRFHKKEIEEQGACKCRLFCKR